MTMYSKPRLRLSFKRPSQDIAQSIIYNDNFINLCKINFKTIVFRHVGFEVNVDKVYDTLSKFEISNIVSNVIAENYGIDWKYTLKSRNIDTDIIEIELEKRKAEAIACRLSHGYYNSKSGYHNVLDTEKIIAKEVIRGTYGNGSIRREWITSMGFNYHKIQAIVNDMLQNPQDY